MKQTYRIVLAKTVYKDMRRFPPNVASAIKEIIAALADNPFPLGSRKLHGADASYRIRFGDYRIIYEVRKNELVIVVIRVRHPKDAYHRL